MAFVNRQGKTSGMRHGFKKLKRRKERELFWKYVEFNGFDGRIRVELADDWNGEYVVDRLNGKSNTQIKKYLNEWQLDHPDRIAWAYLGYRNGEHVFRIYDQHSRDWKKPKEISMNHIIFDVLMNGQPEPPPTPKPSKPAEPTTWDTGQEAKIEVWST